ncbi:MAG: putative metallopeptidase [Candidatus Diapherotrites archaeon]|nr:metallopeptidase [Candidatus Micrarchaeota archaeon]MBU1939931.1 metallopeptidase [Candidatus Micrarchaeota archaeon]
MKYEICESSTSRARELVQLLEMNHVMPERVVVIRSRGTKTRRTIARIHTMGKVMQLAMQVPAFYAIELICEKYDRLSPEDQDKTLIHELLHIPHSFGGGFRHHKTYVNARTVDRAYEKLKLMHGSGTGVR